MRAFLDELLHDLLAVQAPCSEVSSASARSSRTLIPFLATDNAGEPEPDELGNPFRA
jgi:hypothetical protein